MEARLPVVVSFIVNSLHRFDDDQRMDGRTYRLWNRVASFRLHGTCAERGAGTQVHGDGDGQVQVGDVVESPHVGDANPGLPQCQYRILTSDDVAAMSDLQRRDAMKMVVLPLFGKSVVYPENESGR